MTDLLDGDISILGRLMSASNHTFAGTLESGRQVIYKPVSGERPLWDFPNGSLAHREYAAYLVSRATGWDVVPETVLRDGPRGPGMVQRWVEVDAAAEPVDLVPVGQEPRGWLTVLEAVDDQDRPVSLIHEDTDPLRRMAVFDVIVNNTDRKGGHVLPVSGGHRYGVDHGVCFHVDDKLRTVLWGWAGTALTDADAATVATLRDDLDGELGEILGEHVTAREIARTRERCERLLREGMPIPHGGWPPIPWPPF